jgi:mannosyl-3-phosphoglycerate phosphatase
MVVSDLDGTLLDHDSYDWQAAAPALALLKARGIPLILATSKTAAEVADLHAALGLGALPAIVENGAGLYRPGAPAGAATAYARIRAALAALPDPLRQGFRGFADMDAAEVARRTGLPEERAALARQRAHSEPGLWQGSAEARAGFLEALAAEGIHARHGGRFLTLSLGRSKADGLRQVARELSPEVVIALGDAPNDIELLRAADIGVIVRNDHAPRIDPLPEEAEGRIRRTAKIGPAGWNEAILALVQDRQDPGKAKNHG